GCGWQQSDGVLSNTGGTFVGINRSTSVTGAEYFGIQAPVTTGYGGMYIQTAGQNTKPFYGYSANNGANIMWTEYDGTTGNWNVHNGGNALTVTSSGSVGIGTAAPAAALDVETTNQLGIVGASTDANGTGVSGNGYNGVYGGATGSDGTGVYGYANGANAYGVLGRNGNSNGAAIYAN